MSALKHLVLINSCLLFAGLGVKFCRAEDNFAVEACDFIVRIPPNSSKGVQRFQTKCEEGHVTWKNPIGALQINFKLRTEMKNIETCFRAAAFKSDVRFYWETTRDNGTTDLEPLCVLNELERSLRREICVQSVSRDSVTLYVDAKSDVNSSTVGCVHIYYATRKVILSQRTTAITEDCRPCTDSELLLAVCTGDYVFQGNMEVVLNYEEANESAVYVRVHRWIRQVQEVDEAFLSEGIISPNRSILIAPYSCGMRSGIGEFLFVGRLRLGRIHMRCAPRFEDFSTIYVKAVQEDNHSCSLPNFEQYVVYQKTRPIQSGSCLSPVSFCVLIIALVVDAVN